MNQLFLAVLNMSIAAVILFAFVMVMRLMLRRYGTAGFRYLLWMPFLLRLLVPYSLPAKFSIYNLFRNSVASPGGMLLSVVYLDASSIEMQANLAGENPLKKQLVQVGCGLWALGVAALLAMFAFQYLRLRAKLKTAQPAPTEHTQELVPRIRARYAPQVLYTPAVQGPIVFGLLHPRVLLPMELKNQPEVRRYILLHEFAHVRWGDHILLLLSYLALAVHWFNPLVWLARALIAWDIERCCDQRVLRQVGPAEQADYAQALVNWARNKKLGLVPYAAFGEQDIVRRVKGVLGWKKLPLASEVTLSCGIAMVFLCTATNPFLPEHVYLPQSSPFVLEQQREKFRQTAYQLKTALETGDAQLLAQLASMDPEYYTPLYEEVGQLEITVDAMRLYYNSDASAELYMQVTVQEGAGLYNQGQGALVAHFTQTEYRTDPFVDRLMPQQKYEGICLADTASEAALLTMRLCQNLHQTSFEANSLAPETVARVCMASAIEDKGEQAPFTPQRMQELAKEYFDLEQFVCTSPEVYDAQTGLYVYRQQASSQILVTQMEKDAQGGVQVTVESYDDPLCMYPLKRLECNLKKAK